MENLSFEKSMERLNEILESLENGEIDLEEYIKLFEEAVKLHKHCSEILNKMEKAIELVLEDGEIKEKEFNLEV